MNKKVLTLSAVMASLLFGAHAHAADTRIGVTIYKYDDNFMSVVRKAIEKDGKSAPDVQLLMNDSQNDQSKQNDQIDVLLAKGVKALAINLVDPAAADTANREIAQFRVHSQLLDKTQRNGFHRFS